MYLENSGLAITSLFIARAAAI